MKYKVVAGTNLDDFCKLVNQDLCDGWILQGGVSVLASAKLGTFVYYQAMTKDDE